MAIITKPTIVKGQANEIDLSKSDLAAVSKVVNDSYFSDQTNWSKVAMEYESDTGEQIEMLIFDASEASPKANFEVSEKAKDNWQVKSVIIMDFDGGYLKLGRGDLTVANFDIVLGSIGFVSTLLFGHENTAGNLNNSSTTRFGQTFKFETGFDIGKIEVGMYVNGYTTGSLSVKVYDDILKTTLLGTSDTVDVSTMPSVTGQFVEFNFSTPVLGLLADTTYYFEVDTTGFTFSGSNSFVFSKSAYDYYVNGSIVIDGVQSLFNSDLTFKLYGQADTVVDAKNVILSTSSKTKNAFYATVGTGSIGQTFTLSANTILRQIVFGVNTSSGIGSIKAELLDGVGGNVLATSTSLYDMSTAPSGFNLASFDFADYTLTGSTQYYIRLVSNGDWSSGSLGNAWFNANRHGGGVAYYNEAVASGSTDCGFSIIGELV